MLDEITFAVVDTETTGLRPGPDRVIELAVVCVRGGEVIETFQSTLAHLRRRLQLPVAWSGDITQGVLPGKGTVMSRGKRAAIYTRSFQAKILRDEPLEGEVERCKAYCATWGYSIDKDQIYYEVQSDGDEQGQPELYRLLTAAKSGYIDVVVITGPGRLSSSPAELITIIQQFQHVGVKVETTEPSFLDRPTVTERDQMKNVVPYRQKKRSKWTEYEMVGAPTIQQQNGQRRVAIYAKGDTNSLQEQIKRCKAYCTSNGYRVNKDQLYSEVRAGTDEQDRPELNPELNRLTEVAKNGLLDVVVLTNVQMFTRRPSYLAVILQVFQDAGVQVETIE